MVVVVVAVVVVVVGAVAVLVANLGVDLGVADLGWDPGDCLRPARARALEVVCLIFCRLRRSSSRRRNGSLWPDLVVGDAIDGDADDDDDDDDDEDTFSKLRRRCLAQACQGRCVCV